MKTAILTLLVISIFLTSCLSEVNLFGEAITSTKPIRGYQKISSLAGNFGAQLNAGDNFGSALANMQDLNGDNIFDLAVGAEYYQNHGAVFLLFLNKVGTVNSNIIISPDLNSQDNFSASITNLGDLDGNGINDLAVGAPLTDENNHLNNGAVWIIYLGQYGEVLRQKKLTLPELADNEQFGYSISNIGDLDKDNIPELAVGAIGHSTSAAQAGAVYILFLNTDASIKKYSKITTNSANFKANLAEYDAFGSSLAGTGDLDGDRIPDLIVGAPSDDLQGLESGAIYVILLTQKGEVKSYTRLGDSLTGQSSFYHLGLSLAPLGDVNHDFYLDLAVSETEKVWIFYLNKDATLKEKQLLSSTTSSLGGLWKSSDRWGSALAYAGDLNKDKTIDLFVSAPADDDVAQDSGAVWLLYLNEQGASFNPLCGNGIIEGMEKCDDGNRIDGDYCSSICTAVTGRCGDGQVQLGENCDDHNGQNADGCSSACISEAGWSCQDRLCQPRCGDGVVLGDEECDDQNQLNDDGCSADCKLEALACSTVTLGCASEVDTYLKSIKPILEELQSLKERKDLTSSEKMRLKVKSIAALGERFSKLLEEK